LFQAGFTGFTFTSAEGTAPYPWSASGMPPGPTVDSKTDDLTGAPTTVGSCFVTVTLCDSESPSTQVIANYTIAIGS